MRRGFEEGVEHRGGVFGEEEFVVSVVEFRKCDGEWVRSKVIMEVDLSEENFNWDEARKALNHWFFAHKLHGRMFFMSDSLDFGEAARRFCLLECQVFGGGFDCHRQREWVLESAVCRERIKEVNVLSRT